MGDKRFYPHKFGKVDLDRGSSSIVPTPEFMVSLHEFLLNAREELRHGLSTPNQNNMSMYTGMVGTAMTLSRLNAVLSHSSRREYEPLTASKKGKQKHGIGLDSSGLCFGLYECLVHGYPFYMEASEYGTDEHSDEILYGRSGLLILLSYFHGKGVRFSDPHLVAKVALSIDVRHYPWSWHDKVYFGGAHGTAGILYALKRVGGIEDNALVNDLISAAALPSGNFKSSSASQKDQLVQWCHGAPGFVPLLVAYLNSCPNAAAYLESALTTIWERGLLTKGCGICHGIAGNGYCFLAAYIATGDQQYYHQACCFASVIVSFGADRCCEHADNPFSLFEGLAGTVHFILDLIQLAEITDTTALHAFKLFDQLEIFN